MAKGLDLREPPALCTCEACLKGRMIQAPHKVHIEPGRYPDELIYIDTIGPLLSQLRMGRSILFTSTVTRPKKQSAIR